MTPKEYCYQKVAPKNSTLYFSLRKVTAEQRDAIVALMAFYQEIEKITLDAVDMGVARTKLNWWRDEIIKVKEGKPSHPVAVFLQTALQIDPLRLIEIIDGLEQNLTGLRFEKFEEVVVHIMRTAGVREILIADILQSSVAREALYQFALVIELVNYMQNLRHYVRKGLIYFSEDELQSYQVTSAMLYSYVTTPEIVELLKSQAEKVARGYELGVAALTAAEQSQSKVFVTRCNIACAILQAIKSEKFSVLEKFIDVTPLKKWWVS